MATGEALADPPSSLFLQRSATSRACRSTVQRSYLNPGDPRACSPARQQSRSGPTTPTRSSPVPVENRHHQYLFKLILFVFFKVVKPRPARPVQPEKPVIAKNRYKIGHPPVEPVTLPTRCRVTRFLLFFPSFDHAAPFMKKLYGFLTFYFIEFFLILLIRIIQFLCLLRLSILLAPKVI